MGVLSEIFNSRKSNASELIGDSIRKSGREYNNNSGTIKIGRDASLTVIEAQNLIGQQIKSIQSSKNGMLFTFESGDKFLVEGMTIDEEGKKDSLDTRFIKKFIKV